MGDRDRLIELLKKDNCPSPFLCDEKCKYANLKRCYEARTADHLIANGVIAPPCKVGDKVYIVKSRTSDDKNLYIIEDVVKRIVFDKSEDTGFIHSRIEFFNTSSVSDWLFQNIFLTCEEAEKALERSKGNA